MNAQINKWVCTGWHAKCLCINSDCVYPAECHRDIFHLVDDFSWYMGFKTTLDAEQVKNCIMCIMCIIWSLNLLCSFRSVWSSVLKIVCGKILVQILPILWIAFAINSSLCSVLTYGANQPSPAQSEGQEPVVVEDWLGRSIMFKVFLFFSFYWLYFA